MYGRHRFRPSQSANASTQLPCCRVLPPLLQWIAERDAQAAAGEEGEEEADEASEPEYGDGSEDEGRAKKQRKSAGGKKQPAKRQKREEKPAKASGAPLLGGAGAVVSFGASGG